MKGVNSHLSAKRTAKETTTSITHSFARKSLFNGWTSERGLLHHTCMNQKQQELKREGNHRKESDSDGQKDLGEQDLPRFDC